jgi:O-methyltransferase
MKPVKSGRPLFSMLNAESGALRVLTDVRRFKWSLERRFDAYRFNRVVSSLYRKYHDFTMIPEDVFADNLRLCHGLETIPGCVVECGVWRGGMSAAMAEVLGPGREYYLLDSFEGLPPAKAIDGPSALAWQANPEAPSYYDNCRAEMAFAEEAMRRSGIPSHTLIKGWFTETLPTFRPTEPILLLRLDADWYESTMDCLDHLYPRVRDGGLIIIDDYYTWDGCSRAVHDFLSRNGHVVRIRQTPHGVAYIRKPTSTPR